MLRGVWLTEAVTSSVRLSRLVRERPRFLLHQALRRPVTKPYRLAGSDVVVHVRHTTPDLNTLEQVLGADHYVLPPSVEERLRALGRPPVIVDLGANIGLFGADMLRRFPDAHVIAFEPEPSNAEVHRRSVAANPGRNWELVEAAAGTSQGTVRFRTGLFSNSAIADGDANGDGTVEVPLRDAFEYLERADLVKVDIEGAEWQLAADPRFARLPAIAIAFEFHPAGCPEPDPHAVAMRILHEAGYRTADAELDTEPGHGTVWGWKQP